MSTYAKLFGSILDSTIWQESLETRIVFITMLAMKDSLGVVEAAVPGLARRAGVSIEATEVALAKFMSPDPHSRSSEYEGRRIEKIDGGWRMLNHDKYKEKQSADDIKRKAAERQRRFRQRQAEALRSLRDATSEITRHTVTRHKSRQSLHTDTDTDADQGITDNSVRHGVSDGAREKTTPTGVAGMPGIREPEPEPELEAAPLSSAHVQEFETALATTAARIGWEDAPTVPWGQLSRAAGRARRRSNRTGATYRAACVEIASTGLQMARSLNRPLGLALLECEPGKTYQPVQRGSRRPQLARATTHEDFADAPSVEQQLRERGLRK